MLQDSKFLVLCLLVLAMTTNSNNLVVYLG